MAALAVKFSSVQVAMVVLVVQEVGGAGWELTIKVSDPELPVLVLPNNRFVVVLLCVPSVEEVTVTVMLHVLFAAIVAPVTVIRLPPEVPVIAPPH